MADPEPGTIVVTIGEPLGDAEVAVLCTRLGALLEHSDAEVVVCDLAALAHPDLGTVDALARLQLTARRLGCRVRLRRPSPELRELLALVGLGPAVCPFGLEPGGQAEQREPPLRVEEGVEPDDAAS